LGQFEDAEEYLAETATAFDVIHGADHTIAVDAWRTVGMLQLKQRKYEEADSTFRKVLEKEQKLFGTESLQVADTSKLLATVLLAKHQVHEANVLFQGVLQIYRALLGDEHPKTKSAQKTLQTVKTHISDSDDLLLRRATAARERSMHESSDSDVFANVLRQSGRSWSPLNTSIKSS